MPGAKLIGPAGKRRPGRVVEQLILGRSTPIHVVSFALAEVERYREWLAAHADGFVVVGCAGRSKTTFTLHRASCELLYEIAGVAMCAGDLDALLDCPQVRAAPWLACEWC